ncbi:lysozyme [Salmonella enterica subsp. enterica serovar Typhimurium]|uniref:lysozyme n=1 Tax=Salmonella enterica TaxID=28901 RepID=UPI000778F22A|nr:glycoside hydrolase family protein [Salmonella enterica]KYF03944.1 lysozyme [Salmonella enterica subsp. enterica serovar Typhimurium]
MGNNALAHATLLKKLNIGDYDGAANEFQKWDHASGKVVPVLTRRRSAERN